MSALLTAERHDAERTAFLIEETRNMGIEVLPPDVNESFSYFSVVPDKSQIRFGFLGIKNVGEGVVEALIQERKKSGPYASIQNVVSRIQSKDLNKKSLESLAKAGVFDQFADRNQVLFNIELLLGIARETNKVSNGAQKSLFGSMSAGLNEATIKLAEAKPATEQEKLLWEKELLGLYVSSHPLKRIRNILEKRTFPITKLKNLQQPAVKQPYNPFSQQQSRTRFRIGGIVSSIKKIITKTGKPMIFMALEDLTDKIEVVVFPSLMENYPLAFQENKIVLIGGRLDSRNGERKFIAEEVEEIVEH